MFKATTVGAALCLSLMVLAPTAQAQSSDLDAVRDVIHQYFQGHATGEGHYMDAAFHDNAKLFWVVDGQLTQRTRDDYISRFSGTPAPDEAERERRIVNIDISGTAAVVKVELDYPRALIHDYMSMLKINGSWKIINKTFVVHARGDG